MRPPEQRDRGKSSSLLLRGEREGGGGEGTELERGGWVSLFGLVNSNRIY